MKLTTGIAALSLVLLPACSIGGQARPSDPPAPSSKMVETKQESRSLYNYALARVRFLDGDAEGTLMFLKEALSEDPTSPFLHRKVAEAYLKLNRPQEAIDACETSLRFDPDYRPSHMLLGMILAAMGNDKEAIPHFTRAMELDPDKEDAYVNLSVSYLKVYEYEGAVKVLKNLLQKTSDSPIAYYYLGKTYDRMKLYREASAYYRKALELKPDFEQAMIDLGLSLEAEGLDNDAAAVYREVLVINPANVNVAQHLVQFYVQLHRLEDALAVLKTIPAEGLEGREIPPQDGPHLHRDGTL